MENVSSIERIADAMELAVMLVPEHMAPDIRRYIASQGRVFTSTQSKNQP
jgi:tRNA G18 (ribose-2'-O)-methylase SpoU